MAPLFILSELLNTLRSKTILGRQNNNIGEKKARHWNYLVNSMTSSGIWQWYYQDRAE